MARVLAIELYTHRNRLIFLHLSTDLLCKDISQLLKISGELILSMCKVISNKFSHCVLRES